ncbi:MAG: DUF86 domain-containing protein [Armatimonadota bacterium]|nr:DUF86 domain-containing protein [Armatimonadota bacterium]
MSSRDWRLRLEDIIDAIGKIEHYVEGMDFEAFESDEKTIDAVLRNMEIIGEASRYVPDPVEESYTDIPWHKMRGIRNVVAHEYFGVSIPIIWRTLKEDIPPLVPMLRQVLQDDADGFLGKTGE